jgi:hypothetical protein
VFEGGGGGLAQQGVVAAAGALVGGLVVVDGVPATQATALAAVHLGPGAAAGGAGPLTVGAGRWRLALLVLVLAPLVALAGARPAAAGALVALLAPGRAPLLAAGALLAAALALAGARALAGAVGGLLASPRAVHPFAAGIVRLLEAGAADRADVPPERWWSLLVDAKREIDLLAYAMQFLPEAHPRLFDLLRGKAAADCRIRIALADPDCRQVAERDAEERMNGSLVARVRMSTSYFRELVGCEGVELRQHATPLYNSVFRFDDEMFVTPHLYGTTGFRAPLLHLRRLGVEGTFDSFAGHFEGVWASAKPVEAVA